MNWPQLLQSVVTALVIAGIIALFRLFREVDQLKTAQKYEFEKIKSEVDDVVTWYKKTSMDALKIATNPTSQRLTELGKRYAESVTGQGPALNAKETQELIDGLKAILNDPQQFESKRQSASLSLRFIETREKGSKQNH